VTAEEFELTSFFDASDRAWASDGLCRKHTDLTWFPSSQAGAASALDVCGRCEVRTACLEYALDKAIMHGIWGGTTPSERERMYKAGRCRPILERNRVVEGLLPRLVKRPASDSKPESGS